VNQRNPYIQPDTNKPVLDAVFVPALATPEFFEGKTVIVVDVLRATTTITTAIDGGCRYVLPQGSIDRAKAAHQNFEADAETAGVSILGGERNGQIVPGFHHGNSPVEYSETSLEDKILILATTNGTVAMEECRLANRVLMGAMVNLTAVAEQVIDDPEVVVLCSGTDRLITREDVIFAGAFLDRVCQLRQKRGLPPGNLTDPGMLAVGHWRSVQQQIEDAAPSNGSPNNSTPEAKTESISKSTLAQVFKNSRGGINLARIGHMPDIEFAANIDSLPVVSELNLKTWQIRRLQPATA
jgi:2-phosphosulfolactate phosphatase